MWHQEEMRGGRQDKENLGVERPSHCLHIFLSGTTAYRHQCGGFLEAFCPVCLLPCRIGPVVMSFNDLTLGADDVNDG
jgi:hypothetical protein